MTLKTIGSVLLNILCQPISSAQLLWTRLLSSRLISGI
nr:MAG TPA: hypothetical protein [Bacteriophage sp.]